MEALELAHETLDTILGYLGFTVEIDADSDRSTLRVSSHDSRLLIGDRGMRLDDIAHLVNRVVLNHLPDAPRIHVDIDNYRASRDYHMIEEAEQIAARVMATGKTIKLEPMNSYQRRLIHNHFKDHPQIRTWSPEDSARLKRISLSLRNANQ